MITFEGSGFKLTIDDAALLAGLADIKEAVVIHAQKQETQMSDTQAKLDELKVVDAALQGKVGELADAFKQLLASMAEAADDPAELQALIDQGNAMIARVDEALSPPAPEPAP